MHPRLLDYYNTELAYLRELGSEFAAQHPKVAARLGMKGIEVADFSDIGADVDGFEEF